MYTPRPIPDVRIVTQGCGCMSHVPSPARGHGVEELRERIDRSQVRELELVEVDLHVERRFELVEQYPGLGPYMGIGLAVKKQRLAEVRA